MRIQHSPNSKLSTYTFTILICLSLTPDSSYLFFMPSHILTIQQILVLEIQELKTSMIRAFALLLLFAITAAENYLRISTREWKTLAVNDSLISTLGKFKATLVKEKCQFRLTEFNETTNLYSQIGMFSPDTHDKSNCENLTIEEKKIMTDRGIVYAEIITGVNFNWSTSFNVDDEGVFRLIGLYYVESQKANLRSVNITYEEFKKPQNFTKPVMELLWTQIDTFGPLFNLRDWKFSIQINTLIMQHNKSSDLYDASYNWQRFNLTHTLIFDFNLYKLPAANFRNLTYHPRCYQPLVFLDFKAPYIFEIDPYWPIATFYEQGGYPIMKVAFSELSQYDFMQQKDTIESYKFYSPCPPKTFQYRHRCVALCPEPYYHQMRGSVGKCVLVCENYTPVNKDSRICACMLPQEYPKMSSEIIIKCPQIALSTPYGCVCPRSTYFDSLLSLSCVQKCPATTFAAEGLCMQCPDNCKTCQLDQFHRNYLKCTQCQNGYTLYGNKGQCVRSCITNYGYSVHSKKCEKCEDPNCIDCSKDPKVCLQCGLMYALFEDKCTLNCNFRGQSKYAGNLSTICIPDSDNTVCTERKAYGYNGIVHDKCMSCSSGYPHLNTCVEQCPSGYKLSNSFCVCDSNEIFINNKCENKADCPMTTYLHKPSLTCLVCPYGCLTCNPQYCTSCYPGYHLYISLFSIICKRNSPLSPCDGQQTWDKQQRVCIPKSLSSIFVECENVTANCRICSKGYCSLCEKGYSLYQQNCVSKCPEKMFSYRNNCLMMEITNCEIPHIAVETKSTIIKNYLEYEQSYPYGQFIHRDNEIIAQHENDPVGYIYFLHKTGFGIPLNQPKQTTFTQPKLMCLKCARGFGLNDAFNGCSKCPQQKCLACYMAKKESCLEKEDEGGGPTKCLAFIDDQTNNCVESCSGQDLYPEFENGILYCRKREKSRSQDYIKIDATAYSLNDQNIMFFVFDRQITEASKVPVKTINDSKLVGQSNDDQTSKSQFQDIKNGCFIEVNGQFNTAVLNFTGAITTIQGISNPAGLSSQFYGASTSIDNFRERITTWLAYIGYIMSIVILCVHFVFIGNQLLYKMDNLIIFVQTIYYFLYTKNLVGRLLAQYYFGWSFAHARFLPNAFDGIIPGNYLERNSPCSYKLVNIDSNFFRNAGFSFFWLLVYLICFLIVTFVVWAIFKILKKTQVWYKNIAINSLYGGIQFFSYNLLFFAMTQLHYSGNSYQLDQQYYNRSQGIAIFIIVVYSFYTVFRLIVYPQGGVYMIKRIFLAAILFSAYQKPIFLLPLIILQLAFCVLRFILESPTSGFEKATIFIEGIIFIIGYLLLFLCLDAGVNTLVISIFIFIVLVYLAFDLTTIYLEYRNEYSMEDLNHQYENQKKMAVQASRNSPKQSQFGQQASRYRSSQLEKEGLRENRQSNFRRLTSRDPRLSSQFGRQSPRHETESNDTFK